ncbi:MAG TPA: hypothetical protein VGB37_05360 [Candidatus Lokiarchaeia archaeon]
MESKMNALFDNRKTAICCKCGKRNYEKEMYYFSDNLIAGIINIYCYECYKKIRIKICGK